MVGQKTSTGLYDLYRFAEVSGEFFAVGMHDDRPAVWHVIAKFFDRKAGEQYVAALNESYSVLVGPASAPPPEPAAVADPAPPVVTSQDEPINELGGAPEPTKPKLAVLPEAAPNPKPKLQGGKKPAKAKPETKEAISKRTDGRNYEPPFANVKLSSPSEPGPIAEVVLWLRQDGDVVVPLGEGRFHVNSRIKTVTELVLLCNNRRRRRDLDEIDVGPKAYDMCRGAPAERIAAELGVA